jgi:hypothetical protein
MIIFVVLGAIVVVGVILSFKYDYQEVGAALALVGAIVLLLTAGPAGCAKATIQGELTSVAVLRASAKAVDLNSSEDVYGKVVDFNQQLAQNKWMNQQWWGDPFVPDEWDTVTAIPVSR